MPIREVGGRICIVRLELHPDEIPDLLVRHADNYPGAHELESAGLALIETGFQPEASADFVQRVCRWGGGDRQMGRVRDNNSPDEVSLALSEGVALARGGEVAKGVDRIRRLRNLGQSFASKQIRFLEPTRAVILDSVIRSGLGYAETATGYAEFLSDCQMILISARGSGQLGKTQAAGLRVCDIEAAIFAKLQGY
ncbi:8-oxoguanine DNA glycosylase OGG fold protein [Bradyrhizobium elkanii]|uniref:8-oxoguanine DNA glycosylase OGG fold protein n=1 Tax=Bradyrhizobium elkanii TaxID=29448 RepID=UPI0035197E11